MLIYVIDVFVSLTINVCIQDLFKQNLFEAFFARETLGESMLMLHESRRDQLGAMKKPWTWLFRIGDEILPSFVGIVINHYKDPY